MDEILDFALVAEGTTDHAVLTSILIGYFKYKNQRGPLINPVFPNPQQNLGGWSRVLAYLRDKTFKKAFQLNQFLIVHIDSDELQNGSLVASKLNADGTTDVGSIVGLVTQLLINEIGADDWPLFRDRFIFAVAVRQIECWLLPLWVDDEKKAAKEVGCEKALNAALNFKKCPVVKKNYKTYDGYFEISKDYRKGKALFDDGPKNPSLKLFLDDLDRRGNKLTPDD